MPEVRNDSVIDQRISQTRDGELRVLVLGQVPPPYGGQTIMTQTLLSGRYPNAVLFHVNATYSTSMADMGRFSTHKVARLASVLAKALAIRVCRRPTVLYYHPAGANRSAIYRDVVLLSILRPLFKSVVFHLHARGLSDAVERLAPPLRRMARHAYANPDVILGPSKAIVEEAFSFGAQVNRVIPNGTAPGTPATRSASDSTRPITILFLNLISPVKGASWLLEAISELRLAGIDTNLSLAGEFASPDYREDFFRQVRELAIDDHVRYHGVVTGEAKWALMASSDIFCVPTTYPQESFGLAMVEASSCALPVVTTNVPGVRELFVDGQSVLLADPNDPSTLGPLLRTLCEDPAYRQQMGREAQRIYGERYTLEAFWKGIASVFADLNEQRLLATSLLG